MHKLFYQISKNSVCSPAKSTFCWLVVCLCLVAALAPAQAQLKGKTVPVGGPPSEPQLGSKAAPKPEPVKHPQPAPQPAPKLPEVAPKSPPVAPGMLNPNISILLLEMDDADLHKAPAWKVSTSSGSDKSVNTAILEKELNPPPAEVSQRPPGKAQMVASPLRRLLRNAGTKDILNVTLDGPSMVRAQNAYRLSQRSANMARATLRRLEGMILKSPGSGALSLPMALQKDLTFSLTRIGQAMGYRAVVAVVSPASSSPGAPQAMLVINDCQSPQSDIIPLRVPATSDVNQLSDNLAGAAKQVIINRLSAWPPSSSIRIQKLADQYMAEAKAAAQKGDLTSAQDFVNQVVGLQPNNAQAWQSLGKMLQKAAPQAAAAAYQRALNITSDNGALWARLALSYIQGDSPSWPKALNAANEALDAGYDSALLRTVMATAEFGRARILAKGGRSNQADKAKAAAKKYLKMAERLTASSAGQSVDVSELMAQSLMTNEQFNQAAQMLDLVARQHPQDLELQKLYAKALSGADDRAEDAFVAWAHVWKLQKTNAVPLSAKRYKALANGFDQHVFNLAKAASILTSNAAKGMLSKQTALPQVQMYAKRVQGAVAALKLMQPPNGTLTTQVQVARLIAGDLFTQALESYVMYLQNSNQKVLSHGGKLHYQAIDRLNSARKSSLK